MDTKAQITVQEARKKFGISTQAISDEELISAIDVLTAIADIYIQEASNDVSALKDSGDEHRSLR